jgi:ribosomal protein S18 acetylase RimI-like enzyme
MADETRFVIRAANDGDTQVLGRLGALLMRTHYAFDPQRFLPPGSNAEEGYGRFLRSQLHDEETVVLVAEQDGRVVGYVYGALEPRSWKDLRDACGFIHDVAVEEGSRRSGAASALVEAAIEWLGAHGAPRVVLTTAEQNAGAQRLFERLGFRRTMVEMTHEL